MFTRSALNKSYLKYQMYLFFPFRDVWPLAPLWEKEVPILPPVKSAAMVIYVTMLAVPKQVDSSLSLTRLVHNINRYVGLLVRASTL